MLLGLYLVLIALPSEFYASGGWMSQKQRSSQAGSSYKHPVRIPATQIDAVLWGAYKYEASKIGSKKSAASSPSTSDSEGSIQEEEQLTPPQEFDVTYTVVGHSIVAVKIPKPLPSQEFEVTYTVIGHEMVAVKTPKSALASDQEVFTKEQAAEKILADAKKHTADCKAAQATAASVVARTKVGPLKPHPELVQLARERKEVADRNLQEALAAEAEAEQQLALIQTQRHIAAKHDMWREYL